MITCNILSSQKTICCLALNERQVLLKIDLQDPFAKGGCVRFPHLLHLSPRESGDCMWLGALGQEIWEPSRWAIAMVPIATTTTLQKLTPAQGLGTAHPSTLSFPVRWADSAIRKIEMKWQCYYTLLRITAYLLTALIEMEIVLIPVV